MTVADCASTVKKLRRRRPPAEMRAQVLTAARALLQADGPQAITLKAVATHAGVTHGNVTYHFGTVAALHTALISAIIEDLTAATTAAVAHLREGTLSTRDVVDVVFDAFAAGGAGRLIAWLAATGADHRLAPLYEMIGGLVGRLAQGDAGRRAGGADAIGLMMAALVVPALGEALIGAGLEAGLGLQPGAVRQMAADGQSRLRARRAAGVEPAAGARLTAD